MSKRVSQGESYHNGEDDNQAFDVNGKLEISPATRNFEYDGELQYESDLDLQDSGGPSRSATMKRYICKCGSYTWVATKFAWDLTPVALMVTTLLVIVFGGAMVDAVDQFTDRVDSYIPSEETFETFKLVDNAAVSLVTVVVVVDVVLVALALPVELMCDGCWRWSQCVTRMLFRAVMALFVFFSYLLIMLFVVVGYVCAALFLALLLVDQGCQAGVDVALQVVDFINEAINTNIDVTAEEMLQICRSLQQLSSDGWYAMSMLALTTASQVLVYSAGLRAYSFVLKRRMVSKRRLQARPPGKDAQAENHGDTYHLHHGAAATYPAEGVEYK